jgi:hypothetical protein
VFGDEMISGLSPSAARSFAGSVTTPRLVMVSVAFMAAD